MVFAFCFFCFFFFFNDTATTEIYTLSLHDASSDLRIVRNGDRRGAARRARGGGGPRVVGRRRPRLSAGGREAGRVRRPACPGRESESRAGPERGHPRRGRGGGLELGALCQGAGRLGALIRARGAGPWAGHWAPEGEAPAR